MKSRKLIISGLVIFSALIYALNACLISTLDSSCNFPHNNDTTPSPFTSVFVENFDTNHIVEEDGSRDQTESLNWRVSSGAYFYSANGVGNTILGSLPASDPWRIKYSISNPLDTDNGYHPQNIFRLVLGCQWQNFSQEAYFKVINDNFSASPNRNASNGLLLFNRYQDAFNLYYTGIRVDGYAVIKKKINGIYYTMASKPFISGSEYDRDNNPNLLPKNIWIGLRSEVKTQFDGTVNVKLYIDNGKTGNWVLAAEADDDGESFGGGEISEGGYAGIRTDFMDVEFSNYKITEF